MHKIPYRVGQLVDEELVLGKVQEIDPNMCKFAIFAGEHYRKDGSCKCDSRSHRAMMIACWEYAEDDFSFPATRA